MSLSVAVQTYAATPSHFLCSVGVSRIIIASTPMPICVKIMLVVDTHGINARNFMRTGKQCARLGQLERNVKLAG